jgi:hypothetical protein
MNTISNLAGQGMVRVVRTILVISLLSLAATQAHAATTLSTMNEVGAAIRACWTPPPAPKGAFVVLDFSFRRDGTLIGAPWASFIRVPGDTETPPDIHQRRHHCSGALRSAASGPDPRRQYRRAGLYHAVSGCRVAGWY